MQSLYGFMYVLKNTKRKLAVFDKRKTYAIFGAYESYFINIRLFYEKTFKTDRLVFRCGASPL